MSDINKITGEQWKALSDEERISEFGVQAVDHKIACDWERVEIKVASICSS